MSELLISFPEPWEDMRPSGSNRYCGACSETIHDLSQLTVEEAEALLRGPGRPCVRARTVGADRTLELKPSRSGRKILVAAGASISLLAAACQTAPQGSAPLGVIVGNAKALQGVKSVTAVSDNGRTYRAKVLKDGSYRFKPLPYGAYALKFIDDCGVSEEAQLVLNATEHSVEAPPMTQICVTVGMVEVEDGQA